MNARPIYALTIVSCLAFLAGCEGTTEASFEDAFAPDANEGDEVAEGGSSEPNEEDSEIVAGEFELGAPSPLGAEPAHIDAELVDVSPDPSARDSEPQSPAALPGDACPGVSIALPQGSFVLAAEDGHTTESFTNDFDSSCGGAGSDRVFAIIPKTSGLLRVTIGESESGALCGADLGAPCWDYAIYARTNCDDAATEIACSNANSTGTEQLALEVTAFQPVYVFIDGREETSSGRFDLILELSEF